MLGILFKFATTLATDQCQGLTVVQRSTVAGASGSRCAKFGLQHVLVTCGFWFFFRLLKVHDNLSLGLENSRAASKFAHRDPAGDILATGSKNRLTSPNLLFDS